MSNKITDFFKSAFEDMKENAKAQHAVDKANFAAAKAESKAQFEEARAMGDPEKRKAIMQAERQEQIAAAQKRTAEAQAAKRLCVSEGYFRAVYKQCFGVSYNQDCINARVLKARYLLSATAMSVYAVAVSCGYDDEKYFARQFRQNVGCSPMQYRSGGGGKP